MDWKISELKYNARTILKTCYWKTVFVAFVLAVVTGGINLKFTSSSDFTEDDRDMLVKKIESYLGLYDEYDYDDEYDFDDSYYYDDGYDYYDMSYTKDYKASKTSNFEDIEVLSIVLIIVGIVLLVAVIIGGTLKYLVFKPLEVGCKKYMVKADTGTGMIDDMADSFKNGIWGRTCLVMFLKSMYIGLWTLLLFVPGIIKAYEYRMIPYIVAEHPDWSKEEIFEMSKRMMDGNKWNSFVLDLSFIGWRILSLFTIGLLNIFYVSPYYDLTEAQLYIYLKMKYDPNEIYNDGQMEEVMISGLIG